MKKKKDKRVSLKISPKSNEMLNKIVQEKKGFKVSDWNKKREMEQLIKEEYQRINP